MKKILMPLFAAFAAFLLHACAANQPGTWNTPSSKPEVVVKGKNVQSRVIGRLSSKGWNLRSQQPNLLVFTSPLNGFGANLYQATMGSSYSSKPTAVVDILTLPVGSSKTRVIYNRLRIDMKNPYGGQQGGTMPVTQQIGDSFIQGISALNR